MLWSLQWKEREAALTKDISSLQRELEERYEQVQRLVLCLCAVCRRLVVCDTEHCYAVVTSNLPILMLRNAIGEDVVKIRLQRELQNKTVRLEAAQTQCEVLERNLSAVKTQNTRLLEEVEALNQRVKQVCVDRRIACPPTCPPPVPPPVPPIVTPTCLPPVPPTCPTPVPPSAPNLFP